MCSIHVPKRHDMNVALQKTARYLLWHTEGMGRLKISVCFEKCLVRKATTETQLSKQMYTYTHT